MEQLAAAMQGFLVLVARLSLAAIFIASAVGNKIPQFRATAEYMKTEGVPNPTFALFGAIGLLLLGGLSLVIGAWTRIGAFFLLVDHQDASEFFPLLSIYGPLQGRRRSHHPGYSLPA